VLINGVKEKEQQPVGLKLRRMSEGWLMGIQMKEES
jgi:hypothetical protein